MDRAPREVLNNRVRRQDLDSEGQNERSCFDQWTVARLTAESRLRRRRKLERRDDDGVQYVWSRRSAAHVLTDERCRAQRYQRGETWVRPGKA